MADFCLEGVSASCLLFFAQTKEENGFGNLRWHDKMTTADVVQQIIKPLTAKQQCALIDRYRGKTDAQGKPYVGKATGFCFASMGRAVL